MDTFGVECRNTQELAPDLHNSTDVCFCQGGNPPPRRGEPPGLLYLIFGHYSVTWGVRMSKFRTDRPGHYGKITRYACGVYDVICSTSPDFKEPGWEAEQPKARAPRKLDRDDAKAEDRERSMRRARAKVRKIALANNFKWFVTLTLSPEHIDRYDDGEVIKRMGQWCSNQVKRRGLTYVLVPERHKDGAIHFHGFFNDAMDAVASGHYDGAGHMIFNLPQWTLGFTAAIEIYGDYPAAVAYVCKYIGKQGDKPGGRWYYSGGALATPAVEYVDTMNYGTLKDVFGDKVWTTFVPGRVLTIVNGIKGENDGFSKIPDNHQIDGW